MSESNIIYGVKEMNNISYHHAKTQRTDFFISKVKHCYEVTLLDGCTSLELGFSPSDSGRIFISLYGQGFCEKNNSEEYYQNTDIRLTIDNTLMMCLDSNKRTFYAITNEKTRSIQYQSLQNTGTWYASLDGDISCINTVANVVVNLGRKPFVNKIPNNFLPFIYGLIDTKDLNNRIRRTCSNQVSFKNILFLTALIYFIYANENYNYYYD